MSPGSWSSVHLRGTRSRHGSDLDLAVVVDGDVIGVAADGWRERSGAIRSA